jgi:hypothetical protein
MSVSDDQDERFERMLLASARRDGAAANVDDAWTRFAAALNTIVPASVHLDAPAPARSGAGRLAAVKWLVLGAVGGASLTAAVMLARRPTHDPLVPAIAPVFSRPTVMSRVDAPARAPDPPPAAKEPRPRVHPRLAVHLAAPSQPTGSSPSPSPSPSQPSALAAEVARIDTARTVSSIGDHDEAIRLIERYHRDFPEGVLAPDADVVALEAVLAKGDTAEASHRAAEFLSRYPNDPHAPRVRLLVSRSGTPPP